MVRIKPCLREDRDLDPDDAIGRPDQARPDARLGDDDLVGQGDLVDGFGRRQAGQQAMIIGVVADFVAIGRGPSDDAGRRGDVASATKKVARTPLRSRMSRSRGVRTLSGPSSKVRATQPRPRERAPDGAAGLGCAHVSARASRPAIPHVTTIKAAARRVDNPDPVGGRWQTQGAVRGRVQSPN